MSENLTHVQCPHPDCGSSDAFSYNYNGYGKCHSCGNGYPKKGVKYEDWVYETYPLNTEDRMQGKTVEIVEETKPKQSVNSDIVATVFQSERGISKEVREFYGVVTGLGSDGEVLAYKYTYPSGGRKYRRLPKSFYGEDMKSDELFGMNLFNAGSSRNVVITEGEEDAMAAYQMLNTDPKYKTPVVSLQSATPSANLWKNKAVTDWLGSFEKIYLSFDSDGKAQPVAEKLMNLFPNKVYEIPHDKYKDANEFLLDKATNAYRSAFFNAKKFVPANTYNTPSQFTEIIQTEKVSAYIPTGIEGLDENILGLMQGRWTLFQAVEGLGKTELMRYLEYRILSKHPSVPIAIMHLEETKKRSLLGLASYHLGKDVTLQDTTFVLDDEGKESIQYLPSYKGVPESEVLAAIQDLTKNENLYQFTLGVDEDPATILDKIRYFAVACGVKYVFWEPIQNLGYSRSDDSTLESWLSQLATKMSRMAPELGVGIVTIAHENDDGNIRDCRMLGKSADVVIRLERDKMAQDETLRNTTKLLVTKNRPTGRTGYGGSLIFDNQSFTLSERTFDV